MIARTIRREASRRRFLVLVSLLAAATLASSAGAAQAQARVHLFIRFDESAGQNPEGIAVDRTGNIYVSIAPLGRVWRIPSGSDEPEPFGAVPGIVPGRDFGMLGLAIDVFGNVYAGVQSADPDANGVWRFDANTGRASRLPGTGAIVFANGLAFDKQGNLYVTDSRAGAIWRVPPGGRAEIWIRDRALAGNGSLGIFIGANGIQYRNGVFTVLNSERRTVVTIPKVGDAPGRLSVEARFPPGSNPDGLALDVHGDAFVALLDASSIARVTQAGSVEIVASGDPIDFCSSLAFGTSHGERHTLYGVNFSIGELFGVTGGAGPGVFSLHAGVAGWPLP